tara:strand:- start:213 stop:986 length:774 start_codon:yes stop_codon:yes gene_type:complete
MDNSGSAIGFYVISVFIMIIILFYMNSTIILSNVNVDDTVTESNETDVGGGIKLSNYTTSINGDGKTNPSVHYLDRHNVTCGKRPINGFVLVSSRDTSEAPESTIYYDYDCLDKEDEKDEFNSSKTTSYMYENVNDDHNDVRNLSHHTISCSTNPLLRFQLKKIDEGDNKDKVYYKYECGDTLGVSCENEYTDYIQTEGNNFDLSKHRVYCKDDKFLSSVQMERKVDDNDNEVERIRYKYSCCKYGDDDTDDDTDDE